MSTNNEEVQVEGIPWGSYTEVTNDTDGIMCIKYGPNILAFQVIASAIVGVVLTAVTGAPLIFVAAISFSAYTRFVSKYGNKTAAQLLAEATADEAGQKGLHCVAPGGKYKSEKLTLSLVHQANVILLLPDSKPTILESYSGAFTVWSGATLNSVKKYNLSSELGHLTHNTVDVQLPDNHAKALEEKHE